MINRNGDDCEDRLDARSRARGARYAKRVAPFRAAQLRRGSELSRQVPVDLEADADLNEGWGCPGHLVVFLSIPE